MTPIAERLVLSLIVALLALPLEVAAGADEASALLAEARRRHGMAEFEQALELLEQAKRRAAPGALLAEIHWRRALCLAELGKKEAAEAAFTDALRIDPQACPDATQAKGNLVALCQSIRQAGRGRLIVKGPAAELTVLVDDSVVGAVPLETRLALGRHRVQVRLQARPVLERDLTLALDQTVELEVSSSVGSLPASAPSGPAPAPRRRLWTWIAGGTALAAAIVAGVVWASAESSYDEWQALAGRDPPPTADEEGRLSELEDAVKRKEVATWTLAATSGALAATAVLLYFWEGRPARAERADAGPRLRLGPGAVLFSSEF